jgi:hypothetical protein
MMGHKNKMICGDEFDAFYFKKIYYWRAGLRKSIKRKFNKRVRRSIKNFLKSPVSF